MATSKSDITIIPTGPFALRQILFYAAGFMALFVVVQRSLRYVCASWIEFDCPFYWPISVFNLRVPSLPYMAVAAVTVAAFYFFTRYLEVKRFRIGLAILFGSLLIAGSTLIQGFEVGYDAPIAGDAQTGVLVPDSPAGQEYYHDAANVTDPVDFFRRYNEIQPTLHKHGHTHPPGAVLTFWALEKLLNEPALIALAIMLIAAFPSGYFVYRLMRTEVSEDTSRFIAFLFLLLPAVQIYYLATLDALIVALLTGVLYLFCFGKGRMSSTVAAVMLTASFLLTFVSLFILPVLIGFDLIVRRSLKRSVIVIGGLVVFHLLFYAAGYDAWHAFRAASLYENPHGFMLFVDPWNYLFTRFEDIAEIIFFFGPFLAILFIRGWKNVGPISEIRNRPLYVLTALGCLTLVGMYITGAWRTGETARACAFIYPYLLFPIGHYLDDSETNAAGRLQIASLVFLQTVGMQFFGNFFW